MTAGPPRPLAGKRVIEFSQFIAGPTAAQMLADFGAEVIKVEPPRGDGSRALPGGAHGSAYYRCFNTGKSSGVILLGMNWPNMMLVHSHTSSASI